MKTWTDTHFSLTETDDPLVSTHTDAVTLHLPGYAGDGRGFSLRVLPAHLPRLRELCAALETLTSQTQHTTIPPSCMRMPARPAGTRPPWRMRDRTLTPNASRTSSRRRRRMTCFNDPPGAHAAPHKEIAMSRDEAHALASRIQHDLTRDSGSDARQRVGVYRAQRWDREEYDVHLYAPRGTWVLHRACHWTRRN